MFLLQKIFNFNGIYYLMVLIDQIETKVWTEIVLLGLTSFSLAKLRKSVGLGKTTFEMAAVVGFN